MMRIFSLTLSKAEKAFSICLVPRLPAISRMVPTTSPGSLRSRRLLDKKVWRMADLPIIPAVRAWKLLPDPRKKPRIAKLKELLQWCDVVHHLGDPDEEGQCLGDEALEYFQFDKPVRRVLINDYNATKIKESLANIRDNTEPQFTGWRRWGLARSRYDWLLGMNGTRAMALRGREVGQQGLLPVGSVQTPLLYIARERDRLIEEFKPHAYQVVTVQLKPTEGPDFQARWKPRADQSGLDDDGRVVLSAPVHLHQVRDHRG